MKTVDSKNYPVLFGEYIREIRENKGLSQLVVAEMAGISQAYYCQLENGKREPGLILAGKLCEVLDTDMKEFVNKCM